MKIFPAIDLRGGRVVRLTQGDYGKTTEYAISPCEAAESFVQAGAGCIHIVDLDGAKDGTLSNYETIREVLSGGKLFAEVGGGIRDESRIASYLEAGAGRVILGTAAVNNFPFLVEMVKKYGEKIAVGVDLKDGYVAIKGWTEKSQWTADAFFADLEKLGVSTVICTDISRDGAMQGTNRALYKDLSAKYNIQLIASGGVSSIEDVKALNAMDLHGAIIGKAYYTGAIDLRQALEVCR